MFKYPLCQKKTVTLNNFLKFFKNLKNKVITNTSYVAYGDQSNTQKKTKKTKAKKRIKRKAQLRFV